MKRRRSFPRDIARLLARLWRRVDGATAIEYAAICALVSVAGVVAMQGMGDQIASTFNTTSSAWHVGRDRNN